MAADLQPSRGLPRKFTMPQTLAFSERKNRWTTFYSFFPENYVNTSQGLYSFGTGRPFKMFSSNNHNNFLSDSFASYDSIMSTFSNDVNSALDFSYASSTGGVTATPLTEDSIEFDGTSGDSTDIRFARTDVNGNAGDSIYVQFEITNFQGTSNAGIASGSSTPQGFRIIKDGFYYLIMEIDSSTLGGFSFYARGSHSFTMSNIKVVNLTQNPSFQNYCEIHPVFNTAPVQTKIFKSISIDGNEPWTIESVENERGQDTSNLLKDYKTKEGVHYSPVYRDANSKGGIINGDDIRSQTLIVKLRNNLTSAVNMFATGLGYVFSGRHGR